MMELTCALIITFVSLVSATPYGYGVKGGAGASAIAQSGASAGAYGGHGDIPVPIPFGNGFSGSFSKSSSSSSSSSSASSSSSSFSYSSAGAGGFSSPGTNGNVGCASGTCHGSGANEISSNHGNNAAGAGLQGYNAANAAASAGAGALSGAGCSGGACDNNPAKCTSGQCQHNLPAGSSNIHNPNSKCTSGHCGSEPYSGSSTPSHYDDSDDIRFVSHSSKSAHDSKDLTSYKDKTNGYTGGSDCHNGNCGTSKPFDSQPGHGHGSTNSYYSQSNNQHATNSNSGTTSGYHLPATDLETPKQDSNCYNGNCNSGQYQPSYGSTSAPSSYNVPIHGAYDTNKQKPQCQDGKCDYPQKGSYSSTPSYSVSTNYLKPEDSHSTKVPTSYYPSSPSCSGPNCGLVPSSQVSHTPGSHNVHAGLPTSNGANLSPAGCTSPSCNPHYSAGAPSGPSEQPGYSTHPKPVDNNKPSTENLPGYTGGFGAPAGVYKPNDFNVPTTGPASHTRPPSTLHNTPTYGSSGPGCSSPNCYGQSPSPGSNVRPGSYDFKPTGHGSTPGENHPTYTGGFGGPTGMLKPNEYNIPTPVTSKPVPSVNPLYNTASPTTPGCKTGNCYGSSPVTGVTSAATAQSGSYGSHTQSGGVTVSTDNSPTYSGGFGGPSGMLKPNEFDIHVANKPAQSVNPSYNNQPAKPSTGCSSPSCKGYASTAGATAAADAQAGSYGASKPSGAADSSSELPPYTGGFGGPTGFLKPNEFDVHNPAPHGPTSSVSPNKIPTGNYNSGGCTSPSCHPVGGGSTHPQSSYGVTTPAYTTNYRKPIGVTHLTPPPVTPISSSDAYTQSPHPGGTYSQGCKSGNCATHPSNGDNPNVPHGVTHPHTGVSSSPSYNFGVTGPSAVATPGDHSHNIPTTASGSNNCKTPNCANIPSATAGANAQSGSYGDSKQQQPAYSGGFGAPSGLLKPEDYSAPATGSNTNDHKKPSGPESSTCASGNCNPKVTSPSSTGYNAATSGAHASASSAASANTVAYSGGFGGPPGFLKPFDDGKIDLTKLVGASNYGSHSGDANIHASHDTKPGSGGALSAGPAGHVGALAGSAAGATAYAGSAANSGLYGFNAGTHDHKTTGGVKGGSPCGGGCGGYIHDGLNGSAAAAGARSLASSGALATGGSFASSSASAHASAGAYTKGGYGKR
ncbi:uncharacterized protein LOC142974341 [Anticarsia gemmatalis]|uniref:uncharacterized protein LOC142974341 n=1 Tax=Anticarsia gemmatalis TaxID=129554 RepID=UPI003F76BA4F